jgi:hypothetical protein
MSEQKINNTFLKAHDQLDSLQKAFREGGKLEKAIAESGGDISVITAVSRALREASNSIVSATSTQTLTEGVLDDNDDDGFMARSQLYFMAKDAIALHGMIDDRDDLEPWVHSKIVAASEGMDAVRRYMEYRSLSATQEPEMEPQEEPEMMTAEASSSRMAREIEHLIQQVDSDMNMNRHYGDVNIAQVVQMVQAGDIEGAAEYVTGQYHDDDGGQNDGVLDGAYADLIDDLNWIVKNINEVSSPSIEFGMFTPGGDAQIENGINHILRKFTDDAIAGTERDRDAMRDTAHKELQDMLADMSEEDAYEEAMDTDVRQRAAAYLEKGILRVYNMLDKGRVMSDNVNESEEKPYICVHAKKGKHECHAGSSYEAAKKAAAHWKLKSTAGIDAHLAVEETVSEGMEFDEKRDGELKTVAQDVFKNALANAKKKAKK